MNLTQAEAIASLYTELMNSIDKTKLKAPAPIFNKERPYILDEMRLDEGVMFIKWSRYIGCGEYEYETTYQPIDELFEI